MDSTSLCAKVTANPSPELAKPAAFACSAWLDAFAERDIEQASSLVELDELIDRANRRVVGQVMALSSDTERLEWGLRMITVSRCLERIGDHAVDIGEQVAYLVTGEFREFTDASRG